MEIREISNTKTFYGRSVGYDGEYHIVKSSNPPCTNLNDISSCCGTTKYKIVREEWDHFDTGQWCDDSHADDEILEFVARKGLSINTENSFKNELNAALVYPRIQKEFWTYVSEVTESVVVTKLCTGETHEIPRDAISEIEFFGKTEGIKNLVLTRLVFSKSPSGRIAESLAETLKDSWKEDAEPALDASEFTAVNGRKVGEFTISCSGHNCRPRDIKHVAEKWTLYKAKIIETKYVSTTPIEIWGDNALTFIATPTLPGSPCGMNVNAASVKVRVEYEVKK